jgi:hypothetical protein
MLRRLAAITAMIVLVAALLLLMRRVYLHHEATGGEDEATASEVRSVAPPSLATESPSPVVTSKPEERASLRPPLHIGELAQGSAAETPVADHFRAAHLPISHLHVEAVAGILVIRGNASDATAIESANQVASRLGYGPAGQFINALS